MRRHPSYAGQVFGRLTVLSQEYQRHEAYAHCLCNCGEAYYGRLAPILRGQVQSCGCLWRERHRKDWTGQTFGLLTVLTTTWRLTPMPASPLHREGWCLCRCVCGTLKEFRSAALRSGHATSCGCDQGKLRRRKDLTGQRFARLLVVGMVYDPQHGNRAACRCDCGNTGVYQMAALRNGGTVSCGCYKAELLDSRRKSLQHKREVSRLSRHRRAAILKNLPCTFTEVHLEFLLHYWHFACAVCGREDGGLWHFIALDHWIPLSHPACPGTTPDNMVPLCHTKKGAAKSVDIVGCNSDKWNKDPLVWLKARLGPRRAHAKLRDIQAFLREAHAFAERQSLCLSA